MATGGVNGGGDAGGASAGGGGGSDIRVGGSSVGQRVVVAGGGGGASSGLDGNSPGPGWGGGLAGGGGSCGGGYDGGGATSTAGGSGGPGVTFEPETYDPSGEAGSLGEGGDGGRFDPLAPVAAQEEDSVAATPLGGWGGGGGGGLFGGGGGGGTEGAFSGCGGGGSALAPGGAHHQAGVVADAQVRLFWCAAPCVSQFSDVATDHPFWWEIEVAAHDDLVLGYPDGRFGPGQAVTRQALASMLYRLAGSPAFDPGAPTFIDVRADHPFFQQIEWMHAEGIATGYADSTFRPSTPITRQAVAAMAVRAAAAAPARVPPSPGFTDVDSSDPFFQEISMLGGFGVTAGFPDGTFRPLGTLTRQAMAVWLLRLQPVTAGA